MALPIKMGVAILGYSQRIQILVHIPSCSLESYYPISVELSSPKLCACKFKPGPRLIDFN